MAEDRVTQARANESFWRVWLTPIVVAVVLLILDQLSKAWIWERYQGLEGASEPLLGAWLRFTLVFNTGVAFGFGQDVPLLFTILPIVISLGALYFYRYHLPHTNRLIQICVGMIVGGAIGNIIDRLRLGFVIDFIHVTWFPGIFNIADSGITVGVLILAVAMLFLDDPHPRPAAPPAEERS